MGGLEFVRWSPLVVVYLLCIDWSYAACPNLCNNNGLCGINSVCICHQGFTGPDCSRRTCPYGVAWADKASAIDTAHADAECSGAGNCDEDTGLCHCFSGFTGHACQRSTCHNNCNNRGQCITMADLALYYGRDYDPSLVSAGDGFGPVYTNWEKDSMYTCKCDYGFFGPDCSLVMCPKGDDPVTVNQAYRQIRLEVVDAGGTFTGYLGINFQDSTSFIHLGYPSSSNCESVMEADPKFADVTCEYSQVSTTTRRFDIAFVAWPTLPKENNLYFHNGNPASTDFLCDVSRTDSTVECTFSDLVTTNLREYEYCSNRGICDFTTGDCLCASGYGGGACDIAHTAYFDSKNAHVFQEVPVKSSDFNSTAINIETVKSSAPDFKLFEAYSNSKSFYVRGDGYLGIDSLRVIESGLTISKGGLMVANGGVNISNDGGTVTNAETSSPAMSVQTTSSSFDDTVLEVRSMATTPADHFIIRAINQNFDRISVRGDGLVGMADTGLYITGGITIGGGGLTAKGGTSIYDEGLTVTGGLTMKEGDFTITDGVDVLSGGMRVTGGATIETQGLVISQGGLGVELGGQTISSGGIEISAGGVSIASGGLVVTDGLSLMSGGMKTTHGGTILSDGLKVSDGISILGHGTTVTLSGVSLSDTGLTVRSGGMTVHNTGVKVTGGISVASQGLVVQNDGVSVAAGGLKVINGLSVNDLGLHVDTDVVSVTGGYSVSSSGMTVTSGVTIDTSGLQVIAGGVTVGTAGMKVTGGLTVSNSGLQVSLDGVSVTGGFSVSQGGINVIGAGVTVVDSGLTVSLNGGTIAAGGMKVIGGMSITSGLSRVIAGGLLGTDGLSVGTAGATVNDGLTIIDTGLYVLNGGASVNANGMVVSDGLSVLSSGLCVSAGGVQVTGGMTLQDQGWTLSAPMTINSGGLAVADGASVGVDGLKVAGGVSISDSGLYVSIGGASVAGGVSVHDQGLTVTGGATIADTGLKVTGGVSISGGLDVSGGMTASTSGVHVETAGVAVDGGFSVQSLGTKVKGGVTVTNTGLYVTANGGTVTGGMKVAGGLTLSDSSLVVGQNLDISGVWRASNGAEVTSGLTLQNSNLKVDTAGVTIVGDVYMAQSLTITGNLYGNSLNFIPSDRRLKTNVEPLKNNLDSVTKLRGVYFNWREDSIYANDTRRQIGVIAQDVESVFPDATTTILNDKYLGVDYIQLIPVLIEAIHELSDNYEELSKIYDELESRTVECERLT